MGQVIKVTIDDQELEFEILDRGIRNAATHRIWAGKVQPLEKSGSDYPMEATLLILQHKRHTFGGVVFEETGEVRLVLPKDFYLRDGCLRHRPNWQGEGTVPYTILRPVSLEQEG